MFGWNRIRSFQSPSECRSINLNRTFPGFLKPGLWWRTVRDQTNTQAPVWRKNFRNADTRMCGLWKVDFRHGRTRAGLSTRNDRQLKIQAQNFVSRIAAISRRRLGTAFSQADFGA